MMVRLPKTEPRQPHYLVLDLDLECADEYPAGAFVALTQDGHNHRYIIVNRVVLGGIFRVTLSPFTSTGPVTLQRIEQYAYGPIESPSHQASDTP